jgi:hypothetical protein
MTRPVKPILFAIIVIATTASTAYTLTLLDQIVHGTLYTYNLTFDLAWANPYWNLLRIIQVLLGAIGMATVAYTMFTLKTYMDAAKSMETMAPSSKSVIKTSTQTQTTQKPAKMPIAPSTTSPIVHPSATAHAPSLAPLPSRVPARTLTPSASTGYTKCLRCGKAFTQPLRMLDFQGDRPRIIDICPFCNEIITSNPRQEKREQNTRFQLKRRNSNKTPKTLISEVTS